MADTAVFTGKLKDLIFTIAKVADVDDRVYDIIPHREKRTLSQNAYYYQLLGKVADKHHISKARLHNDMLQHYGQEAEFDGQRIYVTIPDTEECENQAMESQTVHMKPSSSTMLGRDGVTYRTWIMLKGSHELTVKEMSILVDGLVQEARQVNVEVLTPQELEHMRQLEQQAEDRKNAQKN